MPFRLPTHVTIEAGCLERLPEVLDSFDVTRVLLVFDQGLAATSWPGTTTQTLERSGYTVSTCNTIEPNPRHTTIDMVAEQARQEAVEVVIGLGGGSVLDAAKAIAMLLTNPGSCLDYEGRNRYAKQPAPFVAIPTTCGTGSEVTWVSVITRLDEARKISVKGETMFPRVALVDANLLQTLPSHLVAYTGLDALTHALEAYTGNASNPVSDALAEQAIGLLFRYLRRAVANIGDDSEAREAVMRASTLAGIGFGNADVAAVHCISETIGGIWDIPHGLGNAIFLAPVMRYHKPFIGARLAKLYRIIRPHTADDVKHAAEAMIVAIEELVEDLKVPAFASLGIAPAEDRRIAEGSVANNSNGSNPQPMGVDDYLAILNTVRA